MGWNHSLTGQGLPRLNLDAAPSAFGVISESLTPLVQHLMCSCPRRTKSPLSHISSPLAPSLSTAGSVHCSSASLKLHRIWSTHRQMPLMCQYKSPGLWAAVSWQSRYRFNDLPRLACRRGRGDTDVHVDASARYSSSTDRLPQRRDALLDHP